MRYFQLNTTFRKSLTLKDQADLQFTIKLNLYAKTEAILAQRKQRSKQLLKLKLIVSFSQWHQDRTWRHSNVLWIRKGLGYIKNVERSSVVDEIRKIILSLESQFSSDQAQNGILMVENENGERLPISPTLYRLCNNLTSQGDFLATKGF